MNAINIPGTITISRPRGMSEGYVRVTLRDTISRIEFAEARIPLADFTEALFGLAEVECHIGCRGLEHVGKKKETVQCSIDCPHPSHERDLIEAWMIEQFVESDYKRDGWFLSLSMSTKGAVQHLPEGGCRVNYSVYRYVDLCV